MEYFHYDISLLFSTIIHLAQSYHNGGIILGLSVLMFPLEALFNSLVKPFFFFFAYHTFGFSVCLEHCSFSVTDVAQIGGLVLSHSDLTVVDCTVCVS